VLSWELNQQQLSLTGTLDKQTSMQLWEQRKQFISKEINILNLDLSALTRLDSAGLATIIALFRELKRHQIGFKIQAESQQVRDLAKVSGVLDLLPFKA